jgi:hypothetical protein
VNSGGVVVRYPENGSIIMAFVQLLFSKTVVDQPGSKRIVGAFSQTNFDDHLRNNSTGIGACER